jgi:hypothetical protein
MLSRNIILSMVGFNGVKDCIIVKRYTGVGLGSYYQ